MTQNLPLFPLHTVLYPGTPIALHIFEERYRQMIGWCLDQSAPFGVVLIRNGSEVDPNDASVRQLRERSGITPPGNTETTSVAIGSSARIVDCHRFDDGRYYLNAIGLQRFRVQTITQQRPYLIATVQILADQAEPALRSLASDLHDLYRRFWKVAEVATGQRQVIEALPEEPTELSYTLAHLLNVDPRLKQRWLEADTRTRLRELTEAIRSELALLPGQRSDGSSPWSLN
ncbi:MAG: LON peptidase substrate-binding domain-containing protein [Roseiflexaceae bacterium]|nr:LON peptidase substrate-binding domain-containing protein [Roseiflexaceae bacterium]